MEYQNCLFQYPKEFMKQRSLPFYLFIGLIFLFPNLYAQVTSELIINNPVPESNRSSNNTSISLLPVRLNEFNAKYFTGHVELTWATELERTFSHFIIEKSINGIDFKETAIVFAKENAAVKKRYSFTDDLNTFTKGVLYYRLRLIGVDYRSKNSSIRIIKIGEDAQQLKVQAFPNPVVNELRITVPSAWQNKQVTYSLYGMNGRILKQMATNNASQTEVLPM